MTTLAKDKPRSYPLGELNDMPMIGSDIIYEGAAVGDNGSGYARPLTAGDPFRGFAVEKCDNSASATDGAKSVKLRERGLIVLPVSAAAITDIDKPVFASDDDTFTFTQSTNSYIGRVRRWVSTGYVEVAYDARRAGFGKTTVLTDNTTGTASDTLASISDAATKNAIASLAAKVNQLIIQTSK
jgi:hypothetical protein